MRAKPWVVLGTLGLFLTMILIGETAVTSSKPERIHCLLAQSQAQAPARNDQPAMIRNGQPAAMHRRLDSLVGEWDVEMTFYIAGGSVAKPLVAGGMSCHREWIAETGNRHLRDVTQGEVGGNPYYRLGILSYSNMDRRYEWNTVDALNSNMMTYKGARNSGSLTGDIVMSGEFTDQGVLGDAYVGRSIRQKTVIKITSANNHVFELYFTPSGEKERLVSTASYTRHP